MTRIYLAPTDSLLTSGESHLALPADAAQHVGRALRMQPGESLTLFDGSGAEWPATITQITKSQVMVQLGAPLLIDRESPLTIGLVQGIAAADKMDWIIQKATELGVAWVLPMAAERSLVRLAGEREVKRLVHWQRVASAACEQCGRNRVPLVHEPLSGAAQLTTLPGAALRLLLNPHTGISLQSALQSTLPANAASNAASNAGITVLIGPEGGLSERELALAERAGFIAVRLGPRVLRTETAGLAVIAALQALAGDYR